MASDIVSIRILCGDRRKAAINETVGEADGTNTRFKLDMFPLVSAPSASLALLSSGVSVVTGNYTVSGDVGVIVFTSAPTAGNTILASYEYYTLNSGELSDFLSGHTGQPFLAASNACLAIAGDSSKLFMYVMGEKSVDKRRIAKELRELSDDLMERHITLLDRDQYTSTVFTFKDNSGTVYEGYDTSVAYLATATG